MIQEKTVYFELTSNDVLRDVLNMNYRLPPAEEFQAQMKAQKVATVQVSAAPAPDFVTSDRDAFFRYLRISNIRGVMFSYGYYTAADIDRFLDLQDADKLFFRKKENVQARPEYRLAFIEGCAIPMSNSTVLSTDTDYEDYLLYCKYMRLALDLSYPKQMDIFAIQQDRIHCCRLEDPWLERLTLPNAAMIKSQCLNSSGAVHQIAFRFDYIPDTGFDPKADASADSMEMESITAEDAPKEPAGES